MVRISLTVVDDRMGEAAGASHRSAAHTGQDSPGRAALPGLHKDSAARSVGQAVRDVDADDAGPGDDHAEQAWLDH